jgi:hypothetical protein
MAQRTQSALQRVNATAKRCGWERDLAVEGHSWALPGDCRDLAYVTVSFGCATGTWCVEVAEREGGYMTDCAVSSCSADYTEFATRDEALAHAAACIENYRNG